MAVQPIPAGFHSITPYVMAAGGAGLIAFLKEAFGAQEKHVMKGPDGSIMHASLLIGDSMLMMSDGRKEWPAQPTGFYLYVPNVDEVYARAIKAGGVSINEPRNEFYGDRMGGVKDPSGNSWWIATQVEIVSE